MSTITRIMTDLKNEILAKIDENFRSLSLTL